MVVRPSSTYTPFWARFDNQRARELEETRALYDWVKECQDRFTDTPESLCWPIYKPYCDLPDALTDEIALMLTDLVLRERYMWELPEPDFERMNLEQFVEYRSLLIAKQYFFLNRQAILDLLTHTLDDLLERILRELPAVETPSPFTIPLVYSLEDPRALMDDIFGALFDDKFVPSSLFREVVQKTWENWCAVTGRDPRDDKSTKPIVIPSKSGLPLDECVKAYYGGTAFEKLLMAPVALKLTQQERFNHTHIVGGTGAGKTTLIENLILHDLRSPDPPSMVIIDPHGDMIGRLVAADLGIEDRLIYINPRDTLNPPALNVFAVNRERFERYDGAIREQVTAGVIQTFDYLFSGLFSADLTAKQSVFFRYVARLMLSLPDTLGRNATILDLLLLMDDPTPYRPAIEALPPINRDFFLKDFMSKTFAQTKEQIRYRLQAIIENPTLARLFTSPDTKVDLFTELSRGSIILVDTAKDFLKDGSSAFGRIFISLTLQAVLERAAIPEQRRKPTFLIVDEAASYFDNNIDDLLTEARKYRCGCVFSHQYLDQATHSLRASFAANTGIKFAAGLSAQDARAMAPEMRTTADFILSQPRLQFAAHIRNVTPHAVSIPIEPRRSLPKLPQQALELLLGRNRARVSFGPPEPTRAETPQPSPQAGTEDEGDISATW